MHVVHLLSDIDERFGGPSYCVPRAIEAMQPLGVTGEIVFTARGDGPDRNPIVERAGLRATGVPLTASRQLYLARGMAAALDRALAGADLLHVHSIWRAPAWQAWRIAARHGVPHVVSPHSNFHGEALRRAAWKKRLARAAFVDAMARSARAMLATAEDEAQAIRAAGFPEIPIAVVPHGLDMPGDVPTREAARATLGLGGGPVALFLGRIEPRKRPCDLLDAFARARDRHPGAQLVLAGPEEEAGYAAALRARADAAGLAGVVHWTGLLRGTDKSAAYAAADVFVLPSEYENFGLAVGEALAHGCPAIVTTRAPWQEIPRQGAGWQVPPRDVPALAAALTEALGLSAARRGAMAIAARRIAAGYAWDRVAECTAAVYREAISGSGPAVRTGARGLAAGHAEGAPPAVAAAPVAAAQNRKSSLPRSATSTGVPFIPFTRS